MNHLLLNVRKLDNNKKVDFKIKYVNFGDKQVITKPPTLVRVNWVFIDFMKYFLADRLFFFIVSIIMPVFEGEKFLQCSINSILNQSHKNFELIIVDDCSKDKSSEIIKIYGKKDERIKCFFK